MKTILDILGWALLVLVGLTIGTAIGRLIWPPQPQLLIQAAAPASRCPDARRLMPPQQFPQTPNPFAVEIRA